MKIASKKLLTLWRKSKDLSAKESAIRSEKKRIKEEIQELFGRAKKLDLGHGSILEKRTIEVGEKYVAPYSYEVIKETSVV